MENIHLFFNTMKLYANLITEFEPYISYKYDFMNVFQKNTTTGFLLCLYAQMPSNMRVTRFSNYI